MQGISPDFLLAFTSSHQPPDVFDYAAIDREVPNMDQASKLSSSKFEIIAYVSQVSFLPLS